MLKHHPRCPSVAASQSEAATAAPMPPSKQARKRRATSDPGESPEPAASQALTRRVNAPEPASTSKKQYNTRREQQIMRLLDETHARRMAAEAAAAGATAAQPAGTPAAMAAAAATAAAGKQGTTHTGFTVVFVP